MEISEITLRITGTFSTAMDTKRIMGPFGIINNLAEYIKEETQRFKELKLELETKADAINLVWDYAAYFFYCHIYTTTQQFDLAEEGRWFKDKICRLLALLKKNGIGLRDDWIYWQYAQVPLEETKKLRDKYPKLSEFKIRYTELAKNAVKKFDPNADYEEKECNTKFFKDTPAIRSDWLDNNLKALKNLIATGECDDKHFAYALYALLRYRDLGLPQSQGEDSEIEAVIRLAAFAAYIDNKAELFANVDNYLTDTFYWFLIREQPGRTELDTWGGVSELIVHSSGHRNYEGDLYTSIRSIGELNSWLQLLGFFDCISSYEGYIVQRCFGYLFAPPDSTDSLYFAGIIKEVINKGSVFLKGLPGFTFCLYWMIHFLDEYTFNEVFLENEKPAKPNAYCKENGLTPIEKRHYTKNSLDILQMLLFFILFDLSSKFEVGYYKRRDVLSPLMTLIKNGTWCNTRTLLKVYKQLGEKIHLNSELKTMLNDLVCNDETTRSMVFLVYNLSRSLRHDARWLVNEVSYIKELQNKHLRIPEHSKLKDDEKNEELSGNKESKISMHQKKLREIDSGFKVSSFMQKIPSFQNLVLSRELTVKLFIDSDVNTLCSDNKFYPSLYRSLVHSKYTYLDRNMAMHYAAFSKVEDLLDPRNFPDLLSSLYDLTHNKFNLQWFVMRENRFEEIASFPHYKDFLAKCLDKMVKFVIENISNDQVFDDEGGLIPNRKELKDLGHKFWRNSSIQKDELKDCLNILYCNSDLMKWHPDYIGKDNEVAQKCYPEYTTDFWNAYKYEMAVYLIKIAIDLTALYK